MIRKILVFLLLFAAATAVYADEVQIRDDHPGKYVVVKGDTLWDIAGRFLTNPWQWPEIWKGNPQISDPHLIYPGDVVVLSYVDGKPTLSLGSDGVAAVREAGSREVKLSPAIRELDKREAIHTIPLDAIQQFLSRPRVVESDTLDLAPYIIGSQDEHLAVGSGNRIYVQGLDTPQTDKYSIFKAGDPYLDPDSGSVLGYEALHIGDAILERLGQPATALVVDAKQEILKGDRLMPQTEDKIPDFMPRAPNADVEGKIISVVNGVSQIGQHQVVVLNRGEEDGLEPGHVLAIYQRGEIAQDPVGTRIAREKSKAARELEAAENPSFLVRQAEAFANTLRAIDENLRAAVGTPAGSGAVETLRFPEERAGEVMVFRTFEKVSYALVMNTQRAVHELDFVRNP
ncbi:MAG: LysM domain-containing protein [Pseudomonadota bacterium]